MEIGLKITFPVVSPEPEVATMIYLHFICGHIMASTRAQGCSKSVQPSLKKMCEGVHTYTHTDISDLEELSRIVYNTRDLRGPVQKSDCAAILYPFYRERQ